MFLTDTNLSDVRLWVFSDEDMNLEDFIDSYNQGIADNMTHMFEFPGKSLEN